ncbi:MAG: hypothetical protein JW847_06625 [Candidatus Omnitrophica bacterium]|nr:hypothetical protein [Candidatus Omnitrophota bacterium]
MGVYYDNGSGGGFVEIQPGVNKGFVAGQYSWTVPGADNDLQNTNKIKLTQKAPLNEDDTAVISTDVFNILGAVTVTQPNNTNAWSVNTTETIKFTMKGALQTVNFYYSATGDAPWGSALNGGTAVTISSLPESEGEYSWKWYIAPNKPLTVGKAGKIRIAVVSPAAQALEGIEGIQEDAFQLKGSITDVKLKDDVTTMVVGDPIWIQWTPSPTLSLYKIYYKKDANPYTVIPATSGGIGGSDAGDGVRQWQWNPVIDIISNNVLIKVEDHYNDNVSGASGVKVVKGKLTVDAPNTTTAYYIGDTVPIRWNRTGSIGTLTIEYSPKGDFSDTQTIAASGVSSGVDGINTYPVAWFAPNKVSEAYRIRIRNNHIINNPPPGTELSDDSDDTFGVRPKFNSISSPTGTSKWFVGDTFRVITWSTTSGQKTDGSSPKVKIEYNMSGGSYVLVDDPGSGSLNSPDGTNNYTWSVIPNVKDSSATIKITYTDYGENVVKIISSPFKLHPQIVVGDVRDDPNYSLNGIAGLQAGTFYTNIVKWTYTGTTVSNVKIYYDDDESGTFAGVIDDSGDVEVDDGAAGVNWSLLNAVHFTTNAKIKVVDSADPNVFGVTPIGEVFKIRGGLTLTAPVNGKVWIAETTQNITWNYKGTTAWNINIYYDPDSTSYSWGDPIDTVSATSGSYPWLVPYTVTNKGAIRIVAQNDSSVESIGTDFKIMAAFDITSPEKNGAVVLEDGKYTIHWNTTNGSGISSVRLYYTNNGDQTSPTWIPIITLDGNPGEYDWPPPTAYNDIKSTKHKVRVTQFDPLNEDTTTPVLNILKDSELYFTIEGGLEFTSPAANQSWGVGTTHAITFTKTGEIREVSVAYSYNGNEEEYDDHIVGTVDTTGDGPYTFNWYIQPNTVLTAGFAGKLRLESTDPTPPIVEEFLTPSLEIKGTVELLKPGGTLDPGGPDPEDKIVLPVNGTYTIQWAVAGAINAVDVHYSKTGGIAGGGTYPDGNLIVTKSVISGTTHGWDVPDAVGTGVRIRVRDHNNYNVWDESDYNFRIKGKLTVDLPTATNIIWYVGETNHTINWTSEGGFSPLDVHFSTNGGIAGGGDYIHPTDFIGEVANCTPGSDNKCTGSVSWKPIPNRIGQQVRVRIRGQESESDVWDESNNNFKILGKLDITSPESAEDIWLVGETFRQITWNASGTITNVKIGYKTAPAGTCIYFANNDGGHNIGANTYNWTDGVANARTETAYICIADVNYPGELETLAFSDAPFKIRPKVTVTHPQGGARLVVDSDYIEGENDNLIKWTVTGTQTTHVEVRYSLNGGSDGYPLSQQIATNIPVANGIAGIPWDDIPNFISNNVTLKVFDIHANLVSGVSAASFKIVGDVFNVQVRNPTDTEDVTALKYGQSYLIKWSTSGTFTPEDKISIKYTMHGEAEPPITYPLTVIASTSRGDGNGSYDWPSVPLPLSNDAANQVVVIRVADYNDAATCDYSAPLKIQSVLDVTQPEDDSIIIASGTQDYQIKWNVTGWEVGDQALIQYKVGAWPWVNAESNSSQPYSVVSGPNTFLWDVPTTQSVISKSVRVRVVDYGDQSNINESDKLFEIRAGLTVTQPIGYSAGPPVHPAEEWLVGETYQIKWNLVGYMATVKMQISVDGSEFADIDDAENINANSGSTGWPWNIPDSISTMVKIRIVNEADPDVYADSPNYFNIIGQLDFSPALPESGDEVWLVGETKTIYWVATGSIPEVNLQYSIDGTNYIDIDGAQNLDTPPFIWTVDDLIDPDIKIRAINSVLDGSKPTTPAVSGNIEVKGQLKINSPTLNALWQVDKTYVIRWTPKGTMDTVRLEYSFDGFASGNEDYDVKWPGTENPADDLDAGDDNVEQSFDWVIPDTISTTVTVRVTNNDDSDVYGDSQLMKIVGAFKVLAPNGGGFYQVDRNTPIQWKTYGTVTNARLQYSTNSFINELQVTTITTVPAGSTGGSFSWPIPPVDDNEVRVRVQDPDSAYVPATQTCNPSGSQTCTISDISDADFEIRPELEFVSANGDSPVTSVIWLTDETHLIKFTKHGSISTVKIEYKVGSGSYDNNFVKDPSGTPASNVSENTFVWRIPIPAEKGLNNVKLRITDLDDSNITVESCAFTVRGGFTWNNPSTANQVMFVTTTEPEIVAPEILSWTTYGLISNIDLKYSTGGLNGTYNFMKTQAGADAENISNCTPVEPSLNCTDTFNWDVPNYVSKNVYVRIVDHTDSAAVTTFGPIKIAGKLYVDEPDNDPQVERWGIGTSQTVRWKMGGTIANLKIEYSLDNGGYWQPTPIAETVAGTLYQKAWTIPSDTPTTIQAIIRISDKITDSGTPPVVSPQFRIVGSFNVAVPTQAGSPAGILTVVENGEIWPVIPSATISWTTAGNVSSVNVLYSKTGQDADWTQINPVGSPISDGGYGGSLSWVVPDEISSTMRIRVRDNGDQLTFNNSSLFTVRAGLKLTAPVGGEKWGVSGTDQSYFKDIKWQRNGSMSKVYLDYTIGGGYLPIKNAQGGYEHENDGAQGIFSWEVPNNLSQTVKVRIRNVTGPAVQYESPEVFKIMARFKVTQPVGGEAALAGHPYAVNWNYWGNVTNAKIDLAVDVTPAPAACSPEYDYDDHVIKSSILASLKTTGTSWIVNNDWVTPSACVRIYDSTDLDTAAYSLAPFALRANFEFEGMTEGMNIYLGVPYTIRWAREGNIAEARIHYSPSALSGGNLTNPIWEIDGSREGGYVDNDENDCYAGGSPDPYKGCFVWTPPDVLDTQDENLHLRIMDPNDEDGFVISPAFNLVPKFTVVSPNGNTDADMAHRTDRLKVGTPYEITWYSSSSSDKTPWVKIYYSINGGGSFPEGNLIERTPNDGLYIWGEDAGGVPNLIYPSMKIRILDDSASNPENCDNSRPCDDSDYTFKIISGFTLSVPNTAATYEVDNTIAIAWTNTGSPVSNVQLLYSTNPNNDNPELWRNWGDFLNPVVIENSITNNSPYISWSVPDDISTTVRVLVRSLTDDGFDISNVEFRIRGKLEITAPTSESRLEIGTTYAIQWKTWGSIPYVDLYYATDGTQASPTWVEIEPDLRNCDLQGNDTTCTSSYVWTVENTPTAVAKFKIVDSRDSQSDVLDTTDPFDIIGNFDIVTPDGGQDWRVNSTYDIEWTWGGTIPIVKLFYSANSGQAGSWVEIDPGVDKNYGAGGAFADGKDDGNDHADHRIYPWHIPETIMMSTNAKIRIEDADNPTVYAESDGTFMVRGAFLVTSPNGNADIEQAERWVTYDQKTITWDTHGTIDNVYLSYSSDDFNNDIHYFPCEDFVADEAVESCVVDTLYRPLSVTANNATDEFTAAGHGLSNGDRVRIGGAALPVGVSNHIRYYIKDATADTFQITASVGGGAVVFETDGSDVTAQVVTADVVPKAVSNANSQYDWDIPDIVIKDDGEYNTYNAIQIRVEDANDGEVRDESDHQFKIDYYKMTWEVFDTLTNSALTELVVYSVKATDNTVVEWDESAVSTVGGRVHYTPYGNWATTWKKTGYEDKTQPVDASADRLYRLYMDTTAVHIWRAVTEYAYTPAIFDNQGQQTVPDKLDLISYLERDGSVMTGAVYLNIKFYEGSARYNDGADDIVIGVDPRIFVDGQLDECREDEAIQKIANTDEGLIIPETPWTDTGLEAGKVYTIVTTAVIGTCGTFTTPAPLSITEAKRLSDMEKEIAKKLDKPLSEVKDDIITAIQIEMSDQLGEIQKKMDVQTGAINTALSNFTSAVSGSIISLETAATKSQTSANNLQIAAERSENAAAELERIAKTQAAKLLIPQTAITGEPVKLRYRGYTTGLTPLIDILNFENTPIVQAVPMIEIPDKPAIYEYVIDEIDSKTYEPGTSFTVIVIESSTGSIESGAVYVETAGGQLLMPQTVLVGDKVVIQFRGREDWKPVLSITNFENETVVDEAKMTSVKDITGMFEYTIDSVQPDVYMPGKPVTITVVEPTTATVESGTFIVESTSLTSLEGLVASGAGVKDVAQDALDAINAVKGTLATGGDVSMALERIKLKINQLPRRIAEEGITDPIVKAVDDIRTQFIQFTGDEGYDFTTLFEMGLEASPTVSGIRSTTDKVQGTTEVMQKVIEQKLGGQDEPVVHSFFN